MLTYQKLVLNLFFFYYIIPVFSNKFNAEFSRKLIKRLKISNCNHSQKKCQRKFPFPQIYELIIGHFNTPASFFRTNLLQCCFPFTFYEKSEAGWPLSRGFLVMWWRNRHFLWLGRCLLRGRQMQSELKDSVCFCFKCKCSQTSTASKSRKRCDCVHAG